MPEIAGGLRTAGRVATLGCVNPPRALLTALNSATTYSRNGAAIGSADVKVGDKVNVVTSADGQEAQGWASACCRCGMRRLVNSTASGAERCDHSGQVKLASSG